MKHILLNPNQLEGLSALEPREDTLYILPKELTEAHLTLTLAHPGVRAFLVGLFPTKGEQKIHINQHHLAANTESHVLLKSLVDTESHFHYHGNIHIDKNAPQSTASQEARGLLAGEGARFQAFPSLEIIPQESICHHRASSGPVNPHSLFVLQTKGFSENEARALLEAAFLHAATDTLHSWHLPEESITTVMKTIPPFSF